MSTAPIPILPLKAQPVKVPHFAENDSRLKEAAKKLEATFLSEMLKAAGFGEARESFGGGAGEEHFSSFLRTYQTENMVDAGGIGLAEALFEAMKVRMDVKHEQ